MVLFEKYLSGDYKSYEDFRKNFKLNAPDNFNFGYDVVDELAKTKPELLALLWTNLDGDVKKISFRELAELSDKAARVFQNDGIKKGDKVMLILKRHYQFWICMVALAKIGATAIPATHLLVEHDITYRINAAGVKAIIATSQGGVAHEIELSEAKTDVLKKKYIVGAKREGWTDFDEALEKSDGNYEKVSVTPDDIMLLYFTSGTTGMPKMVAHNFHYALGHIVTAVYWHHCEPGGLHLTVSDSGWGKCAWGKLFGQWMAESTVFVYDFDKFIPENLLKIIEKFKITSFCAPPTIYRYFIKEDLSKYDFSALKYVTTAGEALNPEVSEQFYKATGLRIREAFGQTETVLSLGNFIFDDGEPGTLGLPNPLFDINVYDAEGKVCGNGISGELCIKAEYGERKPGLFMGYYKDEEATKNAWHDGLYHTGDLAWRDERGMFRYVGRIDDVIKSSGYRIGPFEVESALMQHPAVLETAITGVPHPVRGQVVKATIVLAKGYEPSDELAKELQDYVKRTTAPYKYPRVVEFVDELPKTISGKIRRTEIRKKDIEKSENK